MTPTEKIWGEWNRLALYLGEGEADRKDIRADLGWSKRYLGGLITIMLRDGLVRCKGPRVWMTQKGLSKMRPEST